jgi:hypothetical protein
MRRFWLIFAGIVSGFVVAIAALRPLYYAFLQKYPDCAPNQQDGQCGLASFMDLLYAAGVAIVLWLVVAIFLSRHLMRRFGVSRVPVVPGK